MKKSWIIVLLASLVAVVGYVLWSLKDQELRFVPGNADTVALIDVKKLSQQYSFTLAKHPSKWFGTQAHSVQKNGIEIPDYIQVFHLQNTGFNQWYSIFDISDKDELLSFLQSNGFKISKNNTYTKAPFSVKMDGSRVVVGLAHKDFEKVTDGLAHSQTKSLYADQLIHHSVASVSYLAKSKIFNFAVYLNDDQIQIKTETADDKFSSMASDLDKTTAFLKLNLDATHTKMTALLVNKKWNDSLGIHSVAAVAELEMVNDKIITYGYDDNFNAVEKVSDQKIIQPNYNISLQSSDAEKTWSHFVNKKWINTQNQFTAIPFQPNVIQKNGNKISIKSKRKELDFGKSSSGNYIFIKNNALLLNSVKSLSSREKQALAAINYVFYGNKADSYDLTVQFKKETLPLILRW